MLSYQHIYHAGNLADCHKHMALSLALSKLPKNAKYYETHAARGFYDITSKEALKTGEAKDGITAIINNLPQSDYVKIQRKIQAEKGANFYAASPYIAKEYLNRANMNLCELHPQEYKALKENMAGAKIYNEDGYRKIFNLISPDIKSGLLLVDPSYEIKTEYEQAAEFVLKAHKKCPSLVIILWYPILAAGLHKALYNIPGMRHELMFKNPKRILGSGLIILNGYDALVTDIEKLLPVN